MGALLGRGLLAGLVGGLAAFAFARTVGETPLGRAISFEQARDAASGLPADPALVSRGIQSSAGLLTATCLYGLALGGIFALVFAAMQGRVLRLRPRASAVILALAGYAIVFAVPFLKYPANPPGAADPDTVGRRTALYLAAIAVSILAAVVAYRAGRALELRFGAWNAALAAVGLYVGVVAAAAAVLPSVHEAPSGFPADLLWQFRLASLGTQACLWAVLGLGFGVLADRLLVPRPAGRRRAAQS